MAMTLTTGRELLINRLLSLRPASRKEHPESLGGAARPLVPCISRFEPRLIKEPHQHLHPENGGVARAKDRDLDFAIFANLEIGSANLVKLAGDFVDEVQPLGCKQNRPLRALTIEFEQSYPLLSVVSGCVYQVIEGNLVDGLSDAPDHRAIAGVENAGHLYIGPRELVIAVKSQFIAVGVGTPGRSAHQSNEARGNVAAQIPRGHFDIALIGLDRIDMFTAP